MIAGQEVTTALSFAADGRSLVGVTTLDAPNGRVVSAPLDARPTDWSTLVPEGDAVLGAVAVRGHDLLVTATRRAVDQLLRFGTDGGPLGTVSGLRDVVAVSALSRRPRHG